MSNVGHWDRFYAGVTAADDRYGDSESYRLGADWLAGCALVEDWGCGTGWFRQFVEGAYRGVDGSNTWAAEEQVDLATYRSTVPGIFMRHVLEHNHEWPKVLANALASFTDRMVLVLFTPWQDETRVLQMEAGYDVPTIGFAKADIESALGDRTFTLVEIASPQTAYRVEHIYLIQAAP